MVFSLMPYIFLCSFLLMMSLIGIVQATFIIGSIVTLYIGVTRIRAGSSDIENSSRLDAKEYINREGRIDQLGRIRFLK